MSATNRFGIVLIAWSVCAALGSTGARGAEYRVTPPVLGSPLARANASAKPGDVILLAGGVYETPIKPARSGAPGSPIVYRAAPGEEPVFANMELAIDLRGRSHVTIEGVVVRDVSQFLAAEKSSHLTVSRCRFDDSWGKACILEEMGEYLRFTDNVVRYGSYLLSVGGGGHHLVEGNTFVTDSYGRTCVALAGVRRSVVRGNKFSGPKRRQASEYSVLRVVSASTGRKSTYNLIEGNLFTRTSSCGIKCAGNGTILRRNVLSGCGTGVEFPGYGGPHFPEAMHDRGNRFYSNVIYDCGAAGVGVFPFKEPHIKDYGDLLVMNNILYRNRCSREGVNETVQVACYGLRPSDARFVCNDVLREKAGEKVIGDVRAGTCWTLGEYEAEFPRWAAGNIAADPLFMNAGEGQFRLKPGSPCIDAGGQLTRTRSAGRGKVVDIEDALFFCDGYGIVEPDVIRVGGERARIVKVDHEANRITVERSISWKAGAPVSLDYAGKAPDIGAYEFGNAP